MTQNKNKARCNMYLDKKNIDLIKSFIKGTGLTFSSYVELLLQQAAENIEQYSSLVGSELPEDIIFTEENGKKYFSIYEAHKILGLASPDGIAFKLSPSQSKKIDDGKWKFEVDAKKGLRVIIGRSKKQK